MCAYMCIYSYKKRDKRRVKQGKKHTQDSCMRIVFGAETSLKTWRVAAEHAWNDGNAPRGMVHWE